MKNEVLIVIDVQNDFCPGGALAVSEGDEIVPLINAHMQRFEHVILTQDWHPAGHSSFASQHPGRGAFETIQMPYGPQTLWPDHCIQGSSGSDFHTGLDVNRAELIIRKGFRKEVDSYSAFFENDHVTPTGLGGYLKERVLGKVTFCGLATDYCVAYSALDARRLGLEVTVLLDACRGIDLDGSMELMLVKMRDEGVNLN
jgi:nicotinamidase/pyrazinamidase